MSYYCEHTEVASDESVVFDDNNTTTLNCEECRSKNIMINNTNQWSPVNNVNMYSESNKYNYDEQLDTPDDSPLLSPSPVLTADPLHCHYTNAIKEDKSSLIKLSLATLLCLLFMITEIVGGYLAHSLALMTDAAHLFADLLTFLISIVSVKLGKKSATSTLTFGYARAEVLGALFSIVGIWVLALVFLILAIQRLWNGDYEINADTMIVVACLGLIFNILIGAVLHGVCLKSNLGNQNHNHSNDVSNINVRAAIVHVIGDLLQSIGVLVAAIIIKVYPNLKEADPICTILFTVIVVFVTRKVARDSIKILMESSPRNVNDLLVAFKNIPDVKHVHSLHVWTISPGKDSLAVHLAVDNHCDRETILNRALLMSKQKFKISNCTIQIESYQETVMNECDECKFLYL